MSPSPTLRLIRPLLAAGLALLPLAVGAQTLPAARLLVVDQDAGQLSGSQAGSLFNFNRAGGTTASPLVEAAADLGAPFALLSGVELSPYDGLAYLTDLGLQSSDDGSIYRVAGAGGGTLTLLASAPQIPDPFDLAVVPGASGRQLVVVDWDSDPSSLGPDDVGGLGHGALFWIDTATGSLTLLSDSTNHDPMPGVPAGDPCFQDPVGVAWSPSTGLLYVADLSADPLAQGYTGAVYSIDPLTGHVGLVASDAGFLALTAIALRGDGTILGLDGVQADSVVWAIDPASTTPGSNAVYWTGGTQYALLEGLSSDAAGNVYLIDSGEYDATSMTFVIPPRIYTVDPAVSDPLANSVIVSESASFLRPVSIAVVDALSASSVAPATLPPFDVSCPSTPRATVQVVGSALRGGLKFDFGPALSVASSSPVFTPGSLAVASYTANLVSLDPSATGPQDLVLSDSWSTSFTLASAFTLSGQVSGDTPPRSRKGDSNFDGVVDGVDLAILGWHYTEERCVDATFWNDADFNDDSFIDGSDLAVLATFFGTRP